MRGKIGGALVVSGWAVLALGLVLSLFGLPDRVMCVLVSTGAVTVIAGLFTRGME